MAIGIDQGTGEYIYPKAMISSEKIPVISAASKPTTYNWLDDIEFFAPPPVVTMPPPMPTPIVQQPAPVAQAPVAQAPVAPAPVPQPVVQQPAPVPQPIVQQPVVRPPASVPQPVVQQPAPVPQPIVQQPAPTPLQILEQQQNIGMAPITAPPPMAVPQPQPVPQPPPFVSAVQLSPRDQALFNRNIPYPAPAPAPAPAPLPSRVPVLPAARPPVASTQAAAQNYATMYQNQMNQYFPAPVAKAAPKPVAQPRPVARPAVASRSTSQVVPYNMASLPQSVQPRFATGNQITMNKPAPVPADTYRGPAVTSQGRLTPQQVKRIVR